MADEPTLTLVAERTGRKGYFDVQAKLGDTCLFRDVIAPAKSADRSKFVEALCAANPAIEQAKVDSELMQIGNASSDGETPYDVETQSQALLRLAESAELFHTPDGKAFATIPVADHLETHPVRGSQFRQWLIRQHYVDQEKPPTSEALQSAIAVLEAKAILDGATMPVFIRIAEVVGPEGRVYFLDLCDSEWRVVRYSAKGWEVIPAAAAPVRFRRPRGMLSLPEPVRGGSLKELRGFFNLDSSPAWRLLVVCLTADLLAHGPYPIKIFQGEQGCAKSTMSRAYRRLIDNHVTLLRSEPKEVRDLMIAASNSWIVSLDNISVLSLWLSDALCRLATGGGFATRTLYEDADETFFEATRPVLMNGIEDLATRFDLLDRCVVFQLPTITDKKRREEGPFWTEFEEKHPSILGALLDAVVKGLARLPGVKLESLPRMADFARWGEAVGRGLGWEENAFLRHYAENREDSVTQAIESSPVAQAIVKFTAQDAGQWKGSAQDLLNALEAVAGQKVTESRKWPKTPRGMSGALRRVSPALRSLGISIDFDRSGDRQNTRVITIARTQDSKEPGNRPSEQSEQSDPSADHPSNSGHANGNEVPGFLTGEDDSDAADGVFPTLEGAMCAPRDGDL